MRKWHKRRTELTKDVKQIFEMIFASARNCVTNSNVYTVYTHILILPSHARTHPPTQDHSMLNGYQRDSTMSTEANNSQIKVLATQHAIKLFEYVLDGARCY